jgi:hypothetical protein
MWANFCLTSRQIQEWFSSCARKAGCCVDAYVRSNAPSSTEDAMLVQPTLSYLAWIHHESIICKLEPLSFSQRFEDNQLKTDDSKYRALASFTLVTRIPFRNRDCSQDNELVCHSFSTHMKTQAEKRFWYHLFQQNYFSYGIFIVTRSFAFVRLGS